MVLRPTILTQITLWLVLMLVTPAAFGQKVGLVLSGGGSSGLSHIGVIKALEENGIPIDYITGTSMGALIGAFYASGFTVEDMEDLFTSQRFVDMTKGKVEDRFIYYFKEKENDASWISFKFTKDTAWRASLPTNIISPVAMDLEVMERLAAPAALANYDFDSLFVPFRCVASDISSKQQAILDKGSLSESVRASMSYPFFLKPITVDGKLLMDGGLYNNFPTDVMNEVFKPDILLGCNVGSSLEKPTEDNILLQIKNLLIRREEVNLPPQTSHVLTPDVVDISVFDFSNPKAIIDSGYVTTLRQLDSIKSLIERRVDTADLRQRRQAFRNRLQPLIFDSINIEGLNRYQSNYVRKVLQPKKRPLIALDDIRPSYYRVFGDDKIKSIYPKAVFNYDRSAYTLELKVRRERDLIADFGGNFSSRPINTGYIGLQYNYLGNYGLRLMANSYFGNLYGSVQLKARLDFPVRLPFYVEGEFTLNRWNFFRSRATFFEDVKPSFLIQNERFGGVNFGFPAGNQGRIKGGFHQFAVRDEYYQTRNFLSTDTADRTFFDGQSAFLQYELSTLNDKLYPDKGIYISVRGRLVDGEELNEPGSTSDLDRNFRELHQWGQLKAEYHNYYKKIGRLRLGFMMEGVYSSQELFNNYSAAILRAPAYIPTPESKTLFLETFRGFQYVAGGHKFIINILNNLDLRLEGYIFQPYQEILRNDETLEAEMSSAVFDRRYTIASGNLVYKSPVGPVSMSVNYYHNTPEVSLERETPLTFLFHFGYVIFNNRALD